MHLGSDFAHPKLGGNLLVHQSGRYQPDDFLLTGGQAIEEGAQFRDGNFSRSTLAVAFERDLNRVEKILIAERLGQEFDGAAFMARTVIGMSPKPEMKIMGILILALVSSA